MDIKITTEEAIMLEAFKTMRKVAKANAPSKPKEKAMNRVFWETMKTLDQLGR